MAADSKYRTRKIFLVLFLTSFVFLISSTSLAFGQVPFEETVLIEQSATATVLLEDFNDNSMNPSWWMESEQGGPTVEESNQQLLIDLPANSAGEAFYARFASKFRIRGDFDVEVAYRLPVWPANNGVRLGILMGSLSFSPHRVSCGNGESCNDIYLVNNNGSLSAFIDASSHFEGKLRVTRTGDLVTGYYYDATGMDWVEISSATKPPQDIYFSLQAWSHDNFFSDQLVQVAFDDFIIHEGQLIVSEVFVPLAIH